MAKKKDEKSKNRKKKPTVAKVWVGFRINSDAEYRGICHDLDDKIVEGLSGPKGSHFANGAILKFFTCGKDVVGLGSELISHEWFQDPTELDPGHIGELIDEQCAIVAAALGKLDVNREISAWFHFV